MNRPTLADVAAVVNDLAMQPIIQCPKTKNKGEAGILCEKLSGIPQTSAHLDCADGEVKVFPLKRTKDGTLVPKEPIAVTMLNIANLVAHEDFAMSTCGTKLTHVLYVPYLRESDEHIRFFAPTELTLTPELTALLARDYTAIREDHMVRGTLTSKTGAFLQTRTKGAGRGAPKTRAFYLKKEFIHAFVTKTW